MADKHAVPEAVPDEESLPRSSSITEPEGVEGHTLLERKFMLINHEIDANGMGRYQWYIWCLCGFGYLLDLLWAQAFGLVLSPLEQELGFPSTYRRGQLVE